MDSRNETITIVGAGCVGLATAIGFASVGLEVTCFDIDEAKIKSLKAGTPTTHEENLRESLTACAKFLHFTSRPEKALSNAEFIFIAVPTPLSEDGKADLSSFWAAVDAIFEHAANDCFIVVKSTVPLGTNAQVRKMARRNSKFKISVVSNPEFLAQGTSIRDTIQSSRIVVGAADPEDGERVLSLYKKFNSDKLLTTPESAEMIKYASNCYLAMRVSYINDIANLCAAVGADIRDVVKGISLDPRIGGGYLSPGLGYGGSCLPKDTKSFYNQVRSEFQYDLGLMKATIDINDRQSLYLCKKIHEDSQSLSGIDVAVLGLSFKAGTDDVRNSIAVGNINYMIGNGAKVTVWDPVAMNNARMLFGNSVAYAASLEEAVKASQIILIATDWPEITQVDFSILSGKKIYDGKNCLLSRKGQINFQYTFIGGEIGRDG